MSDYSNQVEILYYVVALCAGVSMLGCIFVWIVYWCFLELRAFPFKLVLYLSISDFFHSLGNQYSAFLLPRHKHQTFCYAQAVLDTYFTLSSVLWTSVIAFSLYRVVIKRSVQIHHLEGRFHTFCWLIPLFVTLLPLLTDGYGPSPWWCWIRITQENYALDQVWRGICLYIPLWCAILFNFYVYIKLIEFIHEGMISYSQDRDYRLKLIRKLKLYPVVLLLCYLFATFNRMLEFVLEKEGPSFWIAMIGAVISNLSGLMNAVVYAFTPAVRSALSSCMSSEENLSEAEDLLDVEL